MEVVEAGTVDPEDAALVACCTGADVSDDEGLPPFVVMALGEAVALVLCTWPKLEVVGAELDDEDCSGGSGGG